MKDERRQDDKTLSHRASRDTGPKTYCGSGSGLGSICRVCDDAHGSDLGTSDVLMRDAIVIT